MKGMELEGRQGSRTTLPSPYENVIAVTSRFQCLAYLAHDGNWYAYYGDELLPDVLHWEPLLPTFQSV